MDITKGTVMEYVICNYQKGIDPTQKEVIDHFGIGKSTLEKHLKKFNSSFSDIKKECTAFFNTQPFIDTVYNFFDQCDVKKDGIESCAKYIGITKKGFLKKLKRLDLKYSELKAKYYSQSRFYGGQSLSEIELDVLCLHYGIYCINSEGYSIPEVAMMLDIRKNEVSILLSSALYKIKNSNLVEMLRDYY